MTHWDSAYRSLVALPPPSTGVTWAAKPVYSSRPGQSRPERVHALHAIRWLAQGDVAAWAAQDAPSTRWLYTDEAKVPPMLMAWRQGHGALAEHLASVEGRCSETVLKAVVAADRLDELDWLWQQRRPRTDTHPAQCWFTVPDLLKACQVPVSSSIPEYLLRHVPEVEACVGQPGAFGFIDAVKQWLAMGGVGDNPWVRHTLFERWGVPPSDAPTALVQHIAQHSSIQDDLLLASEVWQSCVHRDAVDQARALIAEGWAPRDPVAWMDALLNAGAHRLLQWALQEPTLAAAWRHQAHANPESWWPVFIPNPEDLAAPSAGDAKRRYPHQWQALASLGLDPSAPNAEGDTLLHRLGQDWAKPQPTKRAAEKDWWMKHRLEAFYRANGAGISPAQLLDDDGRHRLAKWAAHALQASLEDLPSPPRASRLRL